MIAGDYNQNIADNEVQKFHNDIGVKEINSHANKLNLKDLDKTYKNGSKPIDSIAATSRIVEYAEESELISYNNIAETEHRVYMIDVNAEDYFDAEVNMWDKINHVVLNLVKRLHREEFAETIEEQLEIYALENDLMSMMNTATWQQIENINKIISRIFDIARKKVEGMKKIFHIQKKRKKQE